MPYNCQTWIKEHVVMLKTHSIAHRPAYASDKDHTGRHVRLDHFSRDGLSDDKRTSNIDVEESFESIGWKFDHWPIFAHSNTVDQTSDMMS